MTSDQTGHVDPLSGFLLEAGDQLYDSARQIYKQSPHSVFRALFWLQQAFFLCRSFESERLVEKVTDFATKRQKVGDMSPPDKIRIWSDLTSASTMLRENLEHGTFHFNFELQGRINHECSRGNYVHAVVLICDPAKHGVMSPLLNLAATAHVEMVYVLGFNAANIAIRAFCKENSLALND